MSNSRAIRAVDRRGNPLSAREREVLTYAAAGATDAVIAKILFITVPTVRSHINTAMLKLEAKNKTQAVATALRNGEIR